MCLQELRVVVRIAFVDVLASDVVMRPNFNCRIPWNLGSASGVIGREVVANGKK
jgi:hypothetical protein